MNWWDRRKRWWSGRFARRKLKREVAKNRHMARRFLGYRKVIEDQKSDIKDLEETNRQQASKLEIAKMELEGVTAAHAKLLSFIEADQSEQVRRKIMNEELLLRTRDEDIDG